MSCLDQESTVAVSAAMLVAGGSSAFERHIVLISLDLRVVAAVFDSDAGKELCIAQTNCHRGHRDSPVAASTTIGVPDSRKTDAPAGHTETNFRLATMRKHPSAGMLSS
jgi:hypothetical protein